MHVKSKQHKDDRTKFHLIDCTNSSSRHLKSQAAYESIIDLCSEYKNCMYLYRTISSAFLSAITSYSCDPGVTLGWEFEFVFFDGIESPKYSFWHSLFLDMQMQSVQRTVYSIKSTNPRITHLNCVGIDAQHDVEPANAPETPCMQSDSRVGIMQTEVESMNAHSSMSLMSPTMNRLRTISFATTKSFSSTWSASPLPESRISYLSMGSNFQAWLTIDFLHEKVLVKVVIHGPVYYWHSDPFGTISPLPSCGLEVVKLADASIDRVSEKCIYSPLVLRTKQMLRREVYIARKDFIVSNVRVSAQD